AIISTAIQGIVIAEAVIDPGFAIVQERIERKVSDPFLDMQHPIYILPISRALGIREDPCQFDQIAPVVCALVRLLKIVGLIGIWVGSTIEEIRLRSRGRI